MRKFNLSLPNYMESPGKRNSLTNLKLKEAKSGFHGDAFLQGGYNHLNATYNNYKSYVSISNRFFNDKFGVIGQVNLEKVNRGSDVMDVSYGGQNAFYENTHKSSPKNSRKSHDKT